MSHEKNTKENENCQYKKDVEVWNKIEFGKRKNERKETMHKSNNKCSKYMENIIVMAIAILSVFAINQMDQEEQ